MIIVTNRVLKTFLKILVDKLFKILKVELCRLLTYGGIRFFDNIYYILKK